MMLKKTATVLAMGFSLALAMSSTALADGTVKVGLILPLSGQFADTGAQIERGVKLYMQEHGDEAAGKKIELVIKDTGGPNPDIAKRLAQELVVRDKVDIIAGFGLTPEALGAAPVATEAKKLMVAMNAATSIVTEKSPYIVRTSLTIPQINYAFGKWAAEQGIKHTYTMVADYGPGHDAESSFAKGFKEKGGEIVGADHSPVANPDFSAFVQRIKAANPEAVYIFIPGGAQPAAVGKALSEKGLTPPATKILAQGELTLPEALQSMGQTAKGIVTAFHYTLERDDPQNKKFVEAYEKANNGRAPDFFSVGGYDGMHLIYAALEKTKGDASGDALVAAAKGMSWQSPRGPVAIDPETRDIIQDVYIREVKEVDGKMQNVIIDTIKDVKDPLHGAK